MLDLPVLRFFKQAYPTQLSVQAISSDLCQTNRSQPLKRGDLAKSSVQSMVWRVCQAGSEIWQKTRRWVGKMKVLVQIATALMLLMLPNASNAGVSYVCRIEGYHSLVEVNREIFALDDPLYVDRQSGQITHPWLGNTYYAHIVLLSSGSDEWSFKVISFSPRPESPDKGGVHSHWFEILTWEDGVKKPFQGSSDNMSFWGSCQ